MPDPLIHDRLAAGSGGARDREAYFAAAYELLSEGGAEAVTLAALGQRLHATTGSFYHHFADMAAFVAAFAERWQRGLLSWFAACAAVDDPLRRHEMIANESVNFLFSGGESAVRAWAHTQPAVASALAVVHLTGHAESLRTVEQILGDPELAGLLVALAACMSAGLASRAERGLDPDRFRQMAAELARRMYGIETELVEVDGARQLRFLDACKPDLPADPPWSSPTEPSHGLDWAGGGPWPTEVGAGSEGRTRSREDYFVAARELLAQHGSDGVTVDALCRRLGVTTGSFRWHFASMPTFVDALATHWERGHSGWLLGPAAEPDPVDRLELLLGGLLCAPDAADTALRAWAHTEPTFRNALRRIDGRRQEVFASTIGEATGDPAADLLGDAMLGLAIGLHQDPPGFDPDTAALMVLVFARRYLRIDVELHVASNQPIFVVSRLG
ncbi:MAG: TetR/AcrR family transcriptional regulator [Sporichthyaceae bacterium]